MFYTYYQNNSGGGFDFDAGDGISHYVIIEADSPQHADDLAENIGLYFDGCDNDIDCPCCGDRWYHTYHSEGHDVPTIYGQDVSSGVFRDSFLWMGKKPEAFIHYRDGRIVPVTGERP